MSTTPFLVVVVPVYQRLKSVSFTSFVFCPFHFISWMQKIFTRHLIIVLTISRSLLDPKFYVPTHNLLCFPSLLTLYIRQVRGLKKHKLSKTWIQCVHVHKVSCAPDRLPNIWLKIMSSNGNSWNNCGLSPSRTTVNWIHQLSYNLQLPNYRQLAK
jgi:hypothetical protein